ncbi:hypothetical protein TNCT_497171 [Trichonephila clavata]|uniref:Uncharacterized protein n=1 Tax=Trichonephila clavata TaxID=2740835 RepID=A0A8X6F2J6_TRICU|nr:hypothetical protein TNCT_497171 [Trichonephila clavata]
MWCLFEIFRHFNLQYCLHLIPYYIFIELLKLKSFNLDIGVQNIDQEISVSLANAQPKEKVELSVEIAENKTIQNYNDDEIDTTKDLIVSNVSDISFPEDTYAFSSGMDKTRSIKKFTPFTHRSNISGQTELTSVNFTETPLSKYSKYEFYYDNGDKFIIDNAEFQKEEKELIDIFNSNLEILPSNPFYERGSYNENYHFIPIPDSPDNPSDEDVDENYMINNHNNQNLEILPSNPFYEMSSYNEGYQFTTIPLNTSTGNYTEEDVKENNMLNYPNLEILPSNPFYEMSSYNEDYQFTHIPLNTSTGNYTDEVVKEKYMPNNASLEILSTNPFYEFYQRGSNNDDLSSTPLNASPDNRTDENVQENSIVSFRKKNFFRKVKSFFKELRNHNCNGFTYERFK